MTGTPMVRVLILFEKIFKMKKHLIFDGKTTMANELVDIQIYKVEGDDEVKNHYEWDYNPYVIDKNQIDVHVGEIMKSFTLENLFSRIKQYKEEIKEIKGIKPNPHFGENCTTI